MFSLVNELLKTRRELSEVKEQLRLLAFAQAANSTTNSTEPEPTISLFVQFDGFFKELCQIRWTITVEELLLQFRQITGITDHHPISLRVLNENGDETLFFLDEDPHRTLNYYADRLKPLMIISIEGLDQSNEISTMENICRSNSSTNIVSTDQKLSFETDV